MILTQSQRTAVKNLERMIKYTLLSSRELEAQLPVKLRANTLIAGSSGVGKSHLVTSITKQLGVPILRLNTSNWMPIGTKEHLMTWKNIRRFLANEDRGVIFLDEVDKINHPESDWFSGIRLEIHELLDGKFPTALDAEEVSDDFDSLWDEVDKPTTETKEKQPDEDLESKLQSKFLVIAAGTWQFAWEKGSYSEMGYLAQPSSSNTGLDEADLQALLSSEIRRRFRSQLIMLPPMTWSDYLDIIQQALPKLPKAQRKAFESEALRQIPHALENNLNFRMLEEVYRKTQVNQFQKLHSHEPHSIS